MRATGLAFNDSKPGVLVPLGISGGANVTLARPSLVPNETGNTAVQFSGTGGRGIATPTYAADPLGLPTGALNNRNADTSSGYGGLWVTSGSATTPDFVVSTEGAPFSRTAVMRNSVNESTGRIALLGYDLLR